MNDGIYGSLNCIIFDGADPEIKAFNNKKEKGIIFTQLVTLDLMTQSAEPNGVILKIFAFLKLLLIFSMASSN